MSAWVSLPKQWVTRTWNKQTSTLQWNRPRSEKLLTVLRFNWTGLYLNCRDYLVGGIGIMSIMLFEFRLLHSPDIFWNHICLMKPKRKFRGLYCLHLHLCLTQSLAVEVSELHSFSSNFMRLALVVFWPSASLAGLISLTRVPLTILLSLKQCDPQLLRSGAKDLVRRWTCWFHQIFASSASSETKIGKKFSGRFLSRQKENLTRTKA